MRLILTLVFLVGCGAANEPPPFEPAGQCDAPGFLSVLTESARDCECVVADVWRARHVLQGLVSNDAHWENVTVRIYADEWIPGRTRVTGVTSEDGLTIWLSSHLGSMAHEMIHSDHLQRGADVSEEAEHGQGWTSDAEKRTNQFWAETFSAPCD